MDDIETTKKIVKRMQNVIFQIMCDIDDYCKTNNITYFLSGGTCLGAVRHHGFIPWDDDGDLMMPRADYERFLIGFAEEYAGKYKVGSLFTDDEWQRPSAQVSDLNSCITTTNLNYKPVGIHLDIFAIDGLPESLLHQKFYYKKLRIMNGIRNTSIRTEFKEHEKYRVIKSVAALITKSIGSRGFAYKMDRYAAKFNYDKATYVGATLHIHYGSRETIRREHMASSVNMLFEGRNFPVPIGYDQYLKNLYGEYMSIPKDAEKNGYTHLDGWIIDFFNEEK